MQKKHFGKSVSILMGVLTALTVGQLGFSLVRPPNFALTVASAQASKPYTVGQQIVVKLDDKYYLATIDKVYQENGFTMIDYSWKRGNGSGSGSIPPEYYKDEVFTVEEAKKQGFTLANAPASDSPPPSPQVSPVSKPSPVVTPVAAVGESGRCPGLISPLTDAEITEILRVHNAARAEVNVPPLTWNCKLAAFSQKWVDRDEWGHSSGADRSNVISGSYVGENLAAAAPANRAIATSGSTDWWNEKQFWNNATKSCQSGKVCGHYTQMVWKSTTEIGCGLNRKASVLGASWEGNSAYLACTYNPGGNYNGEAPY